MNTYHQSTSHSYRSVRQNARYIDWATQPSGFKHYPHFYFRYPLVQGRQLDDIIRFATQITHTHKTHTLRIYPSAGALYPVELYVQMRRVEGWLDGIYHVDAQNAELVLLREIATEGLEGDAGLEFGVNGALFLISSPYFRSSWKYHNRALRYCLLDSGHLLGAVAFSASLFGATAQGVLSFEKVRVAQMMGFENKEFAMVLSFIGEPTPKRVFGLGEPLGVVAPSDYFEPNPFVENSYHQSLTTPNPVAMPLTTTISLTPQLLLARRSIRAFKAEPISTQAYHQLFAHLPRWETMGLELYWVVNHVNGLTQGVYHEGELVRVGDFRAKAGYLCLEQSLGSQSAVTFFITAKGGDYQATMLHAGLLGHHLYLVANALGIGASGIGAYYDEEVQNFLESENLILYALGVGR